ncbi:hypothetical protein ACWEV3_04535 [Saccharopolyspora sp. NPDC003752]
MVVPSSAPLPVVTIGDIVCTPTEVMTPSGTAPVGEVAWTFTDMSRTTRTIPAWAIVLCVLFIFFCFLGLLFLLAKEERTEGWVQVGVQGPRLLHFTQIAVTSPMAVADLNARVNTARAVSFQAGQQSN